MLSRAVHRKWPKPEDKEVWYKKFAYARRLKMLKRYEEQGGKCCYCDRVAAKDEEHMAQLGVSKRRLATSEHVIPQANGGTDHYSNIVMSCSGCNSARGIMSHHKFIELRQDEDAFKKFLRDRSKYRFEERRRKSPEKEAKRNARLNRRIEQFTLIYLLKPELMEPIESFAAEITKMKQTRHRQRIDNSELELELVIDSDYRLK